MDFRGGAKAPDLLKLNTRRMEIPFNKPHYTGREAYHVAAAGASGKLSGNGAFTARCHEFFKQRYGFGKVLLTNSCTDALEMTALLARIAPGDEVIMPSFTFVSTANAFILRGAKIIFADSSPENPNLDVTLVEALITSRTRAIVAVHYAGIACEMDALLTLAFRYNLLLIEDAAHAIDSTYRGRPLGSIGHMAAFSFHETKNISCGEGGMLTVNDSSLAPRSEIIWEKGTNRAAFYRGEVDKYGWVDVGSSFLPSELVAAYLLGQLDMLDDIQQKRRKIFDLYREGLSPLEASGVLHLPVVPDYAAQNGHLFYLVTGKEEERDGLIRHLKEKGIQAVFHYLPLHQSPYFRSQYKGPKLPYSQHYAACMLRLPFFYDLSPEQSGRVVDEIFAFFRR
jgi:dTDP-4-amino-4,6-dideoxygalactose transaminase